MSEANYIHILGKEISFADERIAINKLKFYEKNPRVLSKLTRASKLNVPKEEKQDVIEAAMQHESSVKNLLKSIAKAGGITDPLIVQQSTYEVLEGNSRLAALRILVNKYEDGEGIPYLTAPCRVVELDDEQIDSLLDQFHVEGKTSWTAYDKAYIAYQRVIVDCVDRIQYAGRITATEQEVRKRIDVIQLMMHEGANNKPELFSYYDQIIRSRKLRRAIENNHKLKSYLLREIKEDRPAFTAAEMRDDIPVIADKPKILKKLIDGPMDFEEARDHARPSTPKRHVAKALGHLREVNRNDLKSLDSSERNILEIEARRCKKEIKRIFEMLSSNLDK